MAYLSCLSSCLGPEAGTGHGRPPTPRDQEDLVGSDSHRGEMRRPAHSWLIPAPPECLWSLAEPAREPDVPGPEQLGSWWQHSYVLHLEGGGFSGTLQWETCKRAIHLYWAQACVPRNILRLKAFEHSEAEAQRGWFCQRLKPSTLLWPFSLYNEEENTITECFVDTYCMEDSP